MSDQRERSFSIIDRPNKTKTLTTTLKDGKTDPNTFIVDLFGIYRVTYRWFHNSFKLVVYD